MKVVVCDDEPLSRERLARITKEGGHEVVAMAKTGYEAIDAVKEHTPDVLLLDVRMPELDGIRAANEIAKFEHPPAIIFVTAFEHYAIKAFKANAIGYLLKPVNKDELLEILSQAKQLNAAQMSAIKQMEESNDKPARQHIAARTHRGVELIALADVLYFIADQKYVKLRHKNGMVLLDGTLKELEQEFEHELFRIHRNALINLNHMEMLESVDSGQYQVRFKGIDDVLAVSRRHLPMLRERMQNM